MASSRKLRKATAVLEGSGAVNPKPYQDAWMFDKALSNPYKDAKQTYGTHLEKLGSRELSVCRMPLNPKPQAPNTEASERAQAARLRHKARERRFPWVFRGCSGLQMFWGLGVQGLGFRALRFGV